jgi:mRNA-degrading endonuclease RelE of RelBE toxin-antitoxin system
MARMKHRIVLAPQAVKDLQKLRAYDRAAVRSAIAKHLTNEPKHARASRIKRLRGLAKPEYRLRVGEIRVFYDVVGGEVHSLAIVRKLDAERWLSEEGERS